MNENIISAFDCFDTIFYRKCAPDSILILWAKNISAQLYFQVPYYEIYKYRKLCENAGKRTSILEELRYENLIDSLYEEISNCYELKMSREDFKKLSYDTELIVEKENLLINQKTLDLVRSQFNAGKKLIIISDFYIGKKFFEDLFHHFDIDRFFSKYYISAEIGVRKSSGHLYKFVLDDLQITPDQIVMHGDNIISDVQIPNLIGINSVHIENSGEVIKQKKKVTDLKLYSSINSDRHNNAFVGYIPSLILFIERLYKEVTKEKRDIILFLSREGQVIQKLFDLFQSICYPASIIRTKYVYVSRRSTMLASMKPVDVEKFERLFSQYSQLNVQDFLFNISIEQLVIDRICKDESIDKYCIIDIDDRNGVIKRLKQNSEFCKEYENNRSKQKEMLKNYMENVFPKSESVCIVDVGWKGTIQDNIYNALDKTISIHGYYFGLVKKSTEETNKKTGLMFMEKSAADYFIFSHRYIEMERVFAANHGQTLSYELTYTGEAIPVVSTSQKDIEIYNYVEIWQKQMIMSFSDLLSEINNLSIGALNKLDEYLTIYYLKDICIARPQNYDIYLAFRNKVNENFGNISCTEISPDPATIEDKWLKKKFCYVDYTYRFLESKKLKCLFPLVKIYCGIVYLIKRHEYKRNLLKLRRRKV